MKSLTELISSIYVLMMLCIVSIVGCADLSQFSDDELQSEDKIIGGENTRAPSWMVSLRSEGDHICGGSLVHQSWVLTAAHCVDAASPRQLTVCVGRKKRNRCRPQDVARVKQIKLHAGWNGEIYNANDIALLKLDRPFAGVRLARLATEAQEPQTGQIVTVRGWGVHGYPNGIREIPNRLQRLDLPYVDSDDCRAIRSDLGYNFSQQNNLVCMENRGDPTAPMAEQTSCSGDSGGPLTFRGVQVGIVSFGPKSSLGQCSAGAPNAYTRVSSYLNWINQRIK